MADDREIVRDEEVGELELLLELFEQVDHLRLDRDVEGGDGLVGDDEVRVGRESAREADPLALAARELVRVAGGRVGGQADGLEQLAHPLPRPGPAREAVRAERLADDAPDAVPRVERGERILEDHLHSPAQRPQRPLSEFGDVTAVEDDAPRGRLVEAQDRPPDGGLTAAGLADEAKGFAAADRQRHTVDCADVADMAVKDDAALDREVELEILELYERSGSVGALRRSHAVAATRVRSHSSAGTGLKQASLCPGSISTSGGTSWRERSTS